MADSRVSDLTGIAGSSVDADNDLLPIIDVSAAVATRSKKISAKELVANTPSFLQSGIGSNIVTRTVAAKLGDVVSLLDFIPAALHSAIRDGTSTTDVDTYLNNALAEMEASTNATHNFSIYVPRGLYNLSATAAPANSASNFAIFGDGQDSTIFKWRGSAGSPMFKYTNPRAIWMRDLSLYGAASAKPSAMVQYHRASGGTIGAATGFCGLQRVRIGSGVTDHTKGVLTSADGGQDSNNEQHIFEDVSIIGSDSIAYHFSHSNSLLHVINRGSVSSYATAAISNDCSGSDNASFRVFGTSFNGPAASVIFQVANPRVAVEIYGGFYENAATGNTKVLSCPTAFASGLLRFIGGWYHMGDPTTTSTVVWNGDATSLLEFHGTTLFSPNGVTYNFQGAGRVNFYGGSSTTASMTYNGETTLHNLLESAGGPTYTQSGSGKLRLVRSSGTNQLAVADIVTSGATPSVSGLKVDGLMILQYSGATNITSLLNGVAGQTVTLFANNGNATLVHGTGTDNPYLQGAANFTMAAGNSITLRKLGTAIAADVWFEIGRKT